MNTFKPTDERRRYPRFQVHIPMRGEVQSGQDISLIIGDISLGGAACRSSHYVPEMTRMSMHIELPSPGAAAKVLRAEGVVVRVEPSEPSPEVGEYRLALFFTHLSDEDRALLQRYLQDHLPARDGGR
jgi:c-di-GMP-binding flagellar brake protein YcgR